MPTRALPHLQWGHSLTNPSWAENNRKWTTPFTHATHQTPQPGLAHPQRAQNTTSKTRKQTRKHCGPQHSADQGRDPWPLPGGDWVPSASRGDHRAQAALWRLKLQNSQYRSGECGPPRHHHGVGQGAEGRTSPSGDRGLSTRPQTKATGSTHGDRRNGTLCLGNTRCLKGEHQLNSKKCQLGG